MIEPGGVLAPVSVEGMLHLAALSVGLLVAYVGIDRIHPPDTHLQLEIENTQATVVELLNKLDAVKPDGTVVFVYEMLPIFVLCHVAGTKIKINFFKRIYRTIALQRHVPLLPYFRNRFDMKLVSIFAIVSTFLFLLMTATTVWPIHFVQTHLFAEIAYTWYVFCLVFIFVTVLASSKLLRIGSTCNFMRSQVDKRLEELFTIKVSAANILSTSATPER